MVKLKKGWKVIKSIGLEKKSREKAGGKQTEFRYFISDLSEEIETMDRAVRGYLRIEIMHWHLDVIFREDAKATIDRIAAQN